MIIWQSAELKTSVSRKEFLDAYKKLLNRDKNELDIEMKEQIVYFADNKNLDFYQKKSIAIRYRWSNRWLEVVVKKRWVNKNEYKKMYKLYNDFPGHQLKADIDQISKHEKTFSCVLKHTYNSMHQSFAFYNTPYDLLTDAQRDFILRFIHTDIKKLQFLIPIQSKTFIFPCEYKEFDILSLEEWRMPKLFWSKFYEITAKTMSYEKNTVDHFLSLCDDLDIAFHENNIYKTQWLYDSYFNV